MLEAAFPWASAGDHRELSLVVIELHVGARATSLSNGNTSFVIFAVIFRLVIGGSERRSEAKLVFI